MRRTTLLSLLLCGLLPACAVITGDETENSQICDATCNSQTDDVPNAGNMTPAAPMTTAIRTRGVAPLSVFFDAAGNASVRQPSGALPDYSTLDYRWSFGDAEAGEWSISGKSKNRASGYVASHVFEQPGTYRVTLSVTDTSGSNHQYYENITVDDPDSIYADKTYFVSQTLGNDANDGLTRSAPFQTIARAMTVLFASDGPRRVLLRRGESWNVAAPISVSNRVGPFTIGTYGTGSAPIVQVQHPNEGIVLSTSVSDVRLMDLDLRGPLPAAAGEGVQLGMNSLLLRTRVSNFYIGVGGHSPNANGNAVVDCEVVDHQAYAMYYSGGGGNPNPVHLAIMGNRFDHTNQNSLLRTYISRSLWQSNRFERSAGSTARLLGNHAPNKSEFVNIADNRFDSTQPWVLEVGPENDPNGVDGNTIPQVVENVVIERNHFTTGGGYVSRFAMLWGSYITVRNNIFDLTGSSWGSALRVDRRGIGPVPVGVRILNNTAYRDDTAPSFEFMSAASADSTEVINNIVYSPVASATVGSGTISQSANSTSNPAFMGTSDFRLQSSSTARDVGVPVPVFDDFAGHLRPLTGLYDLGAYEFGQ